MIEKKMETMQILEINEMKSWIRGSVNPIMRGMKYMNMMVQGYQDFWKEVKSAPHGQGNKKDKKAGWRRLKSRVVGRTKEDENEKAGWRKEEERTLREREEVTWSERDGFKGRGISRHEHALRSKAVKAKGVSIYFGLSLWPHIQSGPLLPSLSVSHHHLLMPMPMPMPMPMQINPPLSPCYLAFIGQCQHHDHPPSPSPIRLD